jgi:very-short-patch-repair endonuclease
LATEVKRYCKNKYNAILEYKILKNPKTNRYLPFDIYIPIYKIFIEINGEQHYIFRKQWGNTKKDFKKRVVIDEMKIFFAKSNGFYLEINLLIDKNIDKIIKKIENLIKEVT